MTQDAVIFDDRVCYKLAFMRPEHLVSNTTGTYDLVLHAINFWENVCYYWDTLIFLASQLAL